MADHDAVVSEELARLIRSQERDDQAERLPPSKLFVRMTDLNATRDRRGLDPWTLDREADPKAVEPHRELEQLEDLAEARYQPDRPRLRLVGTSLLWNGVVVGFDPKRDQCPACGGRRLQFGELCLVCSRAWFDGTAWIHAAPRQRAELERKRALAAPKVRRRAAAWTAAPVARKPAAAPPRGRKVTHGATIRVRLLGPLFGRRAGDVCDVRAGLAEVYIRIGAAERVR